MYMEVKIKHLERSAYYLTLREGEDIELTVTDKAANQTKLCFCEERCSS